MNMEGRPHERRCNSSDKLNRATARDELVPGFEPWLTDYNHAFQSWAQFGAVSMEGAAETSREIMTFWVSRVQAYTKVWKALASCRTPGEFFECQRQFAESTTAQYCDEAASSHPASLAP